LENLTLKAIYVHIDYKKLPYGHEFTPNQWVFEQIPPYAQISIDQTKKYLNTEPIILSNDYINNYIREESIEFYRKCKEYYTPLVWCPFWYTSLFRLFVLYTYCRDNNIEKFIHLEYDNLVYSDFKHLDSLPPSIYFTRVGYQIASAGFVYCNSLEYFTKFNKCLDQLLTKSYSHVMQATKYPHLSEMQLIDIIYNYKPGTIDYLPTLPFEPSNDNFDKTGTLFDGASYGQHLGGTNHNQPPGYADEVHYSGAAIIHNKIKVIFDKVPYVIYNDNKIPICNLHIHSKKLENFIC